MLMRDGSQVSTFKTREKFLILYHAIYKYAVNDYNKRTKFKISIETIWIVCKSELFNVDTCKII
jgi:hypothetical protein